MTRKAPGTPNDTCSICLEDMVVADTVCTMSICTHAFHSDCIWNWALQQTTAGTAASCPVCRGPLTGCNHRPESVCNSIDGVLDVGQVHGIAVLTSMTGNLVTQVQTLVTELQTLRDETLVYDIVRSEASLPDMDAAYSLLGLATFYSMNM